MHGEDEKCLYNFSWGKLSRPRHRWQVNIKMDLKKLGVSMWTGFFWARIGSGGILLNMIMKLQVP
jgi:hypothetical protein